MTAFPFEELVEEDSVSWEVILHSLGLLPQVGNSINYVMLLADIAKETDLLIYM